MEFQLDTLGNKFTSTFRIQKRECLQLVWAATTKYHNLGLKE